MRRNSSITMIMNGVFPVADDHLLFQKLCLEGFQSGLSWRTILAKRENFRAAFHNFDFDEIARFNETDVHRLLNDAGIVRHRGKIEATINNAARAQEIVQEEGSLAAYLWRYEPSVDQNKKPRTASTSEESTASAGRISLAPSGRDMAGGGVINSSLSLTVLLEAKLPWRRIGAATAVYHKLGDSTAIRALLFSRKLCWADL